MVVDDFAVSGHGWSVTGLQAGVTETGAATTSDTSFSATLHFDSTGKLNGKHEGRLSMHVENDQSLRGATNRDLNGGHEFVWRMTQSVIGNSGDLWAVVETGTDLGELGDKLYGISDKNSHNVATLLDGVIQVDRTVSIGGWRKGSASEFGGTFLGDVFSLKGTDSDTVVLQATYDDSLIVGDELALAAAGDLFLGWLDGAGDWVNAVAGNTGGAANFILAGYEESYLALGNYGIDTDANTVWAVINHNSEFGALNNNAPQGPFAVPEPTTLALAVLATLLLAMRRLRRR